MTIEHIPVIIISAAYIVSSINSYIQRKIIKQQMQIIKQQAQAVKKCRQALKEQDEDHEAILIYCLEITKKELIQSERYEKLKQVDSVLNKLYDRQNKREGQ